MIESDLYGPGWVKCARCGVTQPKASLEPVVGDPRTPASQCKNTAKCAEWKASLGVATQADLDLVAKGRK